VISDQIEPITQYVVLSAPAVTVQPTNDPAVARILMKPTAANLMALSPNYFSRNIPISKISQRLWDGIFENKHIPATLIWSQAGKPDLGVVLTLSLKTLDESTGLVVMLGTLSSSITPTLRDKAIYLGEPFSFGVLRNASITLDDQQGRVVRAVPSPALEANPPAMDSADIPIQKPTVVTPCLLQPLTNCQNALLRSVDVSGMDLFGSDFSGLT